MSAGRRLVLAALTLGAWSCQAEGPLLPSGAEVRLQRSIVWPGERLVFTSESFRSLTVVPTVTVGGTGLVVVRTDDTTFTAGDVLLAAGNSIVALRVGEATREGPVTVAGFVRSRTTPPMQGWPLPTEAGSPIVYVAADSNVLRYDLRSGATVPLPVRHTGCVYSVGSSYRGEASLVASDSCRRPVSWTLAPATVRNDSVSYTPSGGERMWSEIAPDRWLMAEHHYVRLYNSAATLIWSELVEQNERLILSPDRALAVVAANNTPPGSGIPILDLATASVRFHLPIRESQAAAWSSYGDTLFAAGRVSGTDSVALYRLSGIDGSLLGAPMAVGPRDDYAGEILLDPEGRWLYLVTIHFDVIGAPPDFRPRLTVYDRQTLASLGEVAFPVTETWPAVAMTVDPTSRRLYVLAVAGWNGSPSLSHAYEFERPPVQQTPLLLGN